MNQNLSRTRISFEDSAGRQYEALILTDFVTPLCGDMARAVLRPFLTHHGLALVSVRSVQELQVEMQTMPTRLSLVPA